MKFQAFWCVVLLCYIQYKRKTCRTPHEISLLKRICSLLSGLMSKSTLPSGLKIKIQTGLSTNSLVIISSHTSSLVCFHNYGFYQLSNFFSCSIEKVWQYTTGCGFVRCFVLIPTRLLLSWTNCTDFPPFVLPHIKKVTLAQPPFSDHSVIKLRSDKFCSYWSHPSSILPVPIDCWSG